MKTRCTGRTALPPGVALNIFRNILIDTQPGRPADGPAARIPDLSAGNRRLRRGWAECDVMNTG